MQHSLWFISYDILGEEIHGSSWSGAERIELDLIRDEFENVYSIDEFVKGRSILNEKFHIGVYITENFRLTTKPVSGMRLSNYYWIEFRTWFFHKTDNFVKRLLLFLQDGWSFNLANYDWSAGQSFNIHWSYLFCYSAVTITDVEVK